MKKIIMSLLIVVGTIVPYVEDPRITLRNAVRDKNEAMIKLLLEEGINPYEAFPNAAGHWVPGIELFPIIAKVAKSLNTPLMEAVIHNNLPLVKELLAQKIDPNLPGNKVGDLPIVEAASRNYLDIVTELLENQADPNRHNRQSDSKPTALHYAAKNNNLAMVQLLLDKKAEPDQYLGFINRRNISKREYIESPLEVAVKHKNQQMVQALLNAHALPNKQTVDGISVLELAAINKDESIIKLLLEAGADFFEKRQEDNPNLGDYRVSLVDRYPIIKKVLKTLNSPLVDAVIENNLPLVKELLANKADPNQPAKTGNTPLFEAVSRNYLDIAITLLDHQADPNRQGPYKTTPLIYAAKNNNLAMVQLLLNKKADPNKYVDTGSRNTYPRALMSAVHYKNELMVDSLLKAKADINIFQDSRSLLELAVRYSTKPIIKLLLEAGADPDQPADFEQWWSPRKSIIDLAKKEGLYDVVQILKNGSKKK